MAATLPSGAGYLRYHFDFETDSDGLAGGLFYNTATGAEAQGANTNRSGACRGSESAERADLPGVTPGNTVMTANAFQWGESSFAFSYWAYDDTTDEDLRGPRVFDCLDGTTTGISVSTNAAGVLNVRIDDNTGASFQSKDVPVFADLIPPRHRWVHVAVNVDRSADAVTISIDGVSQGTADLSGLTGEVFATRELQVGVINDGVDVSDAQHQGIDDLAFYPGLLSPDQVTALAGATTTPMDILPGFGASGRIAIVAVSYDAGEVAVVFASENGKTYSVFGGTDLSGSAAWPEVSVDDLVGSGSHPGHGR